MTVAFYQEQILYRQHPPQCWGCFPTWHCYKKGSRASDSASVPFYIQLISERHHARLWLRCCLLYPTVAAQVIALNTSATLCSLPRGNRPGPNPNNVSRSASVGHVHSHTPGFIKELCSLQQEFSDIKCQECVLTRVMVRSSYGGSQQHMKLLPMNTEAAKKKKQLFSGLDFQSLLIRNSGYFQCISSYFIIQFPPMLGSVASLCVWRRHWPLYALPSGYTQLCCDTLRTMGKSKQ